MLSPDLNFAYHEISCPNASGVSATTRRSPATILDIFDPRCIGVCHTYTHYACSRVRSDGSERRERGRILLHGARHDVVEVIRRVKLNFSRRPTFSNQSTLLWLMLPSVHSVYACIYSAEALSLYPSVSLSPSLSRSISRWKLIYLRHSICPSLFLSSRSVLRSRAAASGRGIRAYQCCRHLQPYPVPKLGVSRTNAFCFTILFCITFSG